MLVFGVIFVVVILGYFPSAAQPAERKDWPSVAPLEASVYFADARKAAAVFKILDLEGKTLYVLQCHNAEYDGDRDFVYSGDFECRLSSTYSKDQYSTLLTENPEQSRDWESRGRVFGQELAGKCGDYPEYGRVRHFRLRKMKITFSFDQMSFKPYKRAYPPEVKRLELQSFRFTLRVEPDPSVLSAIAEIVSFVEPPRAHPETPNDFTLNCDMVIKRK